MAKGIYVGVTKTLGDYAEGDIIQLNESGSPVDFYVAKHNYESGLNGAGRTLLVRKEVYDVRMWHSSNVSLYATSEIDSWLNSTYKNLLDADVRTAMGITKFYYTFGNGNWTVTELTRSVFLLSVTELGKTATYANTEGTALDIASSLQIAYHNGNVTTQWTRSPCTYNTGSAYHANTLGNFTFEPCFNSYGSRPAFTLPSSYTIPDKARKGKKLYVGVNDLGTVISDRIEGDGIGSCGAGVGSFSSPQWDGSKYVFSDGGTAYSSGSSFSRQIVTKRSAGYYVENVNPQKYYQGMYKYGAGNTGTVSPTYTYTHTSGRTGAQKVKKAYVGDAQGLARLFFQDSITIGTISVGNTVKLRVDGTARDFIVVHQGAPSSLYDGSCNGTWLLMKEIYDKEYWESSIDNNYKWSDIHSYLNGTFLGLLDADIQAAIQQVKLPYHEYTSSGGTTHSGANGLSAKVFLLSGYEMGWTTSDYSYFPVDGAKLSYFDSGTGTAANNKRIGYYGSTATDWWLRSPDTDGPSYVWSVYTNGSFSSALSDNPYGVRPAFVMPCDFAMDESMV